MIKKIKFTDVNPLKPRDSSIIKKEIFNTIKTKNFILGRDVKKFENNFSKLSQIKYSASCASGTDALILALKSLDIWFESNISNKLNYQDLEKIIC